MLLDVTLTNYRSVKETQTVSFEAATDKSLDEQQLIPVDERIDLIKISAVLGSNGSGKSAVLRAVEGIQSFVLAGENEANPLSIMTGSSFAFDKEWSSKPSKITIRSIIGKDEESGLAKIYCYTLEADREKIHKETLFVQIGRSTRRMFERILVTPDKKGQTQNQKPPVYAFSWGKQYYGEKKKLGKKVTQNRSFLQTAALADSESAVPMYEWFKNSLSVIPLGLSTVSEQLIINILKQKPSWRKKIIDFLWCMDLMDIRDIRIAERGTERLIYIHGSGDTRFASYFTSESLGVRRLTLIAITFMEAFIGNKTVISDDFSIFIHPSVTRHLLNTFIRGTGKSKSQLFISGVDATLLDDKLIRRDGIWFTTKGRSGGTICYSLSDYKYRQKHDASDMYINGAFGALPILSDFIFDPGKES
ncbi:MAG: ATP-binding protein [Bacteroidetes bacterium]|nr:ATP-binding protein [Bacteroidota bacterium]